MCDRDGAPRLLPLNLLPRKCERCAGGPEVWVERVDAFRGPSPPHVFDRVSSGCGTAGSDGISPADQLAPPAWRVVPLQRLPGDVHGPGSSGLRDEVRPDGRQHPLDGQVRARLPIPSHRTPIECLGVPLPASNQFEVAPGEEHAELVSFHDPPGLRPPLGPVPVPPLGESPSVLVCPLVMGRLLDVSRGLEDRHSPRPGRPRRPACIQVRVADCRPPDWRVQRGIGPCVGRVPPSARCKNGGPTSSRCDHGGEGSLRRIRRIRTCMNRRGNAEDAAHNAAQDSIVHRRRPSTWGQPARGPLHVRDWSVQEVLDKSQDATSLAIVTRTPRVAFYPAIRTASSRGPMAGHSAIRGPHSTR